MHKALPHIVKHSGEIVPFNVAKIQTSLARSGARKEVIDRVIREVSAEVHEGMSTRRIYRLTHRLLKKYSRVQSHRYHLKQAIMELGPSGYPFEKLAGEILKELGFSVQVGIQMQGKHVVHEVDVFAERENLQYIVECKYHNRPGQKSDVKVPLYIRSRFLDIEEVLQPEANGKQLNGWILTNTRFSSDAIQYGKGVGLRLMSWDYPDKYSLKATMTQLQLHPITSITDLTKREKQELLERDIVLCKNAIAHPEVLEQVIRDERKRRSVWKQLQEITHPDGNA